MFRIFPLFWLVTIINIILSRQLPEADKLILNFTGLFGFIAWDSYIATGAWSIGNELVFYSFFPILVYLAKVRTRLFWLFGAIIIFITLYYSFSLLPDSKYDSALLWKNYINPLNQLIYFFLGIAIGKLSEKVEFKRNNINLSIFFLSILLFAYYSVGTDSQLLIMGWNRYVFTFACVGMVYAFYNLRINEKSFYHKPLVLLGEVSYSLYLFHPIVFSFFDLCRMKLNISVNTYLFMAFCTILSLVLSYLSYEYFEKKVIMKGNQIFKK